MPDALQVARLQNLDLNDIRKFGSNLGLNQPPNFIAVDVEGLGDADNEVQDVGVALLPSEALGFDPFEGRTEHLARSRGVEAYNIQVCGGRSRKSKHYEKFRYGEVLHIDREDIKHTVNQVLVSL
jgi:hypothetical protein